jgi:serine/threonine protein kinase
MHLSGADSELHEGEVVLDRFRVEERLAHGATSTVYRVHDRVLGRDVALKVLARAAAEGSIAARRFEREAQLVARLDHPAIVKIYGNGWLETRQPWLALELIAGETLESLLTREPALPIARVARLLSDVLDALSAAHAERVLHRDLKPANIMVIDETSAKLLDFGVSRDLADHGERITAPTQLIGTLGYLAPEQLVATSDPDDRADLWAVGVVAYRALTGRSPFGLRSARVLATILESTPEPPSTIQPTLGPAIDAFFVRALAKNRDHRFQTATEMKAALTALA